MLALNFIPDKEFQEITQDAVNQGYWRYDMRILEPGSCWYMPWVSDPDEVTPGEIEENLELYRQGKRGPLSLHYWQDWALIRPPICVVCPNGRHWMVDANSTNGNGWKVEGKIEKLTCSPSIVVPGYHGYLQNGEFTDDIEGRGPQGHLREQAPSPRDLNPNDYK